MIHYTRDIHSDIKGGLHVMTANDLRRIRDEVKSLQTRIELLRKDYAELSKNTTQLVREQGKRYTWKIISLLISDLGKIIEDSGKRDADFLDMRLEVIDLHRRCVAILEGLPEVATVITNTLDHAQ